jgi:hypothetical protein
MKLQKLFKSYKILVTAAVMCIKEGINCVKIKSTNVIKLQYMSVIGTACSDFMVQRYGRWKIGIRTWVLEDSGNGGYKQKKCLPVSL